MLAIIILFIIGFGVGLLIRRWLKTTKPVEYMVTIAIWLLLFILGASVGTNRVVMENLPTLGIWALVIAAGAVGGSIATVSLIQHYFFSQNKSKK